MPYGKRHAYIASVISPWSIHSHAICAARAAHWAEVCASAIRTESQADRTYYARQLTDAAKRLTTEAETISAKVAAGEGSVLETRAS